MIRAIKPMVGRLVRSEAYHAFWLAVYGLLVVAILIELAMWQLTGWRVVIATSVALVTAISIETAIATHAGAWSAEKAAEQNEAPDPKAEGS